MKKLLKIVIGLLVVLITVIIIVSAFFLGPTVRKVVTTGGPKVLGVPVEMGSTAIFPLRGKVNINDLIIGNPEGFKSDSLFELHRLKVDMKPKSVFSDTIEIDEILISGVYITYETSVIKSNLGTLLDRLESKDKAPAKEDPAKETETPAAPPKEGGKSLLIKQIVLEDLKVTVASTLAGGKGITLPVDRIVLKDLGGKSGGVTGAEATVRVIKAIAVGVTKALAANAGKLVGAGLDVGKMGVDLGVDTAKLLGGAAVGTAGAAVDGAAAAGSAALGGAAVAAVEDDEEDGDEEVESD